MYGLGPKLRISDHTVTDELASDLELRLDHQYKIRIGFRRLLQGWQNDVEGDEGKICHH
jgi:hypothetical protein